MPRAHAFLRSLLSTTALRTPHPMTRNRPVVMIPPPVTIYGIDQTHSAMESFDTITFRAIV